MGFYVGASSASESKVAKSGHPRRYSGCESWAGTNVRSLRFAFNLTRNSDATRLEILYSTRVQVALGKNVRESDVIIMMLKIKGKHCTIPHISCSQISTLSCPLPLPFIEPWSFQQALNECDPTCSFPNYHISNFKVKTIATLHRQGQGRILVCFVHHNKGSMYPELWVQPC